MTYNVLMGTLNPTHSLTHSLTHYIYYYFRLYLTGLFLQKLKIVPG